MSEAPAARPLAEMVARLAGEGLLVGVEGEVAGPLVAGIADDSRSVQPGQVFVAVRGQARDGHAFVGAAVAAGAVAVVTEGVAETAAVRAWPAGVPRLVVTDSRLALASLAAWWNGDPSLELTVVGVTGTNGKTTTTYLAAAGLGGAGRRPGLVSTVGTVIGGAARPNTRPVTTPGAVELQGLLRRMVLAGDDAAVIETSSHGLAAERVASVAYDAAIFTSLSHEHLDFHGTMEAYVAAKRSLFERLPATAKDGRPGLGVVHLDDARAETFIEATRAAGARVVTYGASDAADVRLVDLRATPRSVEATFTIASGGHTGVGRSREHRLRLRFGGRYNARNALAVVGLAHGWDLPLDGVIAGLAALRGVPGRLEAVERRQPFSVLVDYAHTSGSIEALLAEVRATAEPGARVAVVIGASGERDEGKRPLMGAAAVRGADLAILSEDDPRGESLDTILAAMAAGAEAAGGRRGESLLVIPDRRAAIEAAIRWARSGDVVVLAGKGHETWMARRDGLEPWDDRVVAAEVLAAEGYASPGA